MPQPLECFTQIRQADGAVYGDDLRASDAAGPPSNLRFTRYRHFLMARRTAPDIATDGAIIGPSAVEAGAWSALEIILRQGVQFVVTIILARLLAPGDFGLIALVSFFSSLAIVLVQNGFSAALVQRPQITLEEESAVFWWNVIASAALALAIIAAGRPLAAYFGQPVLQPLMLVAAAQLILSSLASVQSALLVRRLQFATLAKVGLGATAISGVLAIVAAAMGAGVWSLGIQLGSSAVLTTVFMWLACGWRPAFHLHPRTLKPMSSFSGLVSLSGFLEVLYSQGFSLLIAKRYGPTELGLYDRAVQTQLMPSSVLTSIIARVALPVFSRKTDDKEALREGVRRASSLVMLINVPAMAGLAVLSDLALYALYGSAWVSAATILSILALSGMLLPLHAINLQLLLAQGGGRSFFNLEVAKKIIGISCILTGSLFGIVGLAWGQLAGSVIALFLNTHLTRKSIGYGLGAQLIDLAGLFFCAAGMALAVVALRAMIDLSPISGFIFLVVSGAAIYFLLGFALRIRNFREAFETGLTLFRKDRTEVSIDH
jgi:O-antigen/teichoic acid export membrane protein